MRLLFKRKTVSYGIFTAIFAFLGIISLASYANAETSRPTSSERLITVHDRGQIKGILTKEVTLRDAFKEANIIIDPSDIVEPGLDEPLIASNYEVNIYRARPITIIDGTIHTKVMSAYQTPKQVAAQAKIVLQDEDTATLQASSDMVSQGAGVQMYIKRATPFTLVLYGTKKTAYTQEKTVGDMLTKKGIRLGKDDTLSTTKETPIQANMTVELWRNGIQTGSEEQDIPFGIEQIKDADHEVGYKQIRSPGIPGKRTVTYAIEMKNGKEVSRKEIQSIVTKQPEKQVEIVGTKMTNTFNGSFGEALARLRSCEGSYTTNTGNGYYGAYQYDISTWASYGGYANASLAPPAVQDEKAWLTYQKRGWQPWPSCSKKMGLQDIYR